MMNYLSPNIPWKDIEVVGFDMDGTLYDEFDFICQVYDPISKILIDSKKNHEEAFQFMLTRWLEKGSSYPFIYEETLNKFNVNDSHSRQNKIYQSLKLFRNFKPHITLSSRITVLLDILKRSYQLFLVSDGSSILQWNKITALKLKKYFETPNIFISGDHGKDMSKPNIISKIKVPVLSEKLDHQVVFIGDRDNDKTYAQNAGFHFLHISSLFKK